MSVVVVVSVAVLCARVGGGMALVVSVDLRGEQRRGQDHQRRSKILEGKCETWSECLLRCCLPVFACAHVPPFLFNLSFPPSMQNYLFAFADEKQLLSPFLPVFPSHSLPNIFYHPLSLYNRVLFVCWYKSICYLTPPFLISLGPHSPPVKGWRTCREGMLRNKKRKEARRKEGVRGRRERRRPQNDDKRKKAWQQQSYLPKHTHTFHCSTQALTRSTFPCRSASVWLVISCTRASS